MCVHSEAEIPSIEQWYWQKFKYVPGVFWKTYQLNFHVCIANVCPQKLLRYDFHVRFSHRLFFLLACAFSCPLHPPVHLLRGSERKIMCVSLWIFFCGSMVHWKRASWGMQPLACSQNSLADSALTGILCNCLLKGYIGLKFIAQIYNL